MSRRTLPPTAKLTPGQRKRKATLNAESQQKRRDTDKYREEHAAEMRAHRAQKHVDQQALATEVVNLKEAVARRDKRIAKLSAAVAALTAALAVAGAGAASGEHADRFVDIDDGAHLDDAAVEVPSAGWDSGGAQSVMDYLMAGEARVQSAIGLTSGAFGELFGALSTSLSATRFDGGKRKQVRDMKIGDKLQFFITLFWLHVVSVRVCGAVCCAAQYRRHSTRRTGSWRFCSTSRSVRPNYWCFVAP